LTQPENYTQVSCDVSLANSELHQACGHVMLNIILVFLYGLQTARDVQVDRIMQMQMKESDGYNPDTVKYQCSARHNRHTCPGI